MVIAYATQQFLHALIMYQVPCYPHPPAYGQYGNYEGDAGHHYFLHAGVRFVFKFHIN